MVFERFTQTDSSYTRQFEGAGLGLAIVKRIAELMGGGIVVDSAPGEGTTVCVALPMLPAPEPGQADAPRTALSGQAGRSLSVLVAEDDRISQMYMQELLTRLGHRATLADDGQAALEALGRDDYDCVLMDVQMPVLDGLKATQSLREHDRALGRPPRYVIAMTAYALSGDREKFLDAGMDDYVSKPVQTEDLVLALGRVPRRAAQAPPAGFGPGRFPA